MKRLWSVLVGLGVSGTSAWVCAANLTFPYGVTWMDINADGVKDMIVKTHWYNGNAHDFDIYKIAIQMQNAQGESVFQEVPLGDQFPYRFATAEGADCLTSDDRALHADFIFALNKKGFLTVTQYARIWEKPEDTYHVEKTVYRLTAAPEGDVGIPPFYLKKESAQKLQHKFCDVRDAMTE